MDDRERREQIRDERAREWRTRRRDPGDLVTWAVVLGGFMAVLIFLCAAYDGHTALGTAVLILIIAWLLVVWVIGKVNVLSILWGRSVSADFSPDRAPVVLGASAVLALVSVGFPLLDLATSLDFGWYGIATGAIGVIYLALVGWTRLRREA
jgi:hypothetical protein